MPEAAIKETEFILDEKSANFFSDALAMKNLRDIYVKLPFGFKKAVKCAKEMRKLRMKGWQNMYKLYPNLQGKSKINVDWDKMIITIIEE